MKNSPQTTFPHNEIDLKWQKRWEEQKCFKAEGPESKKPKYYVLDMFPYPSGSGLHIGHLVSYTPPDVVARYKRARGYNVLHPMGYDAFGLPAEQYAIQSGIHPAETTSKAIQNFRRQLKAYGFSFDWEREISTCEPEYYKWTQFIFLKLFEKGLAYQKEVPVNWCPALKTVLANEEVIDGKSERGGHPVIRVPMRQWMLNITAYAERLLEGLDTLDWPERTKEGQRNWIGKSEGAEIEFAVEGVGEKILVFTTRPDTLFGVTFLVVAPEHPLVAKISTRLEVKEYIYKASLKSEIDRKAQTEKSGVFTGAQAIHPLTGQKIPIWIADYVLPDYGTGAIMAVPAHDSRDYEFAKIYSLPILQVVEGAESETGLGSVGAHRAGGAELPWEGEGRVVNSKEFTGLTNKQAARDITKRLESLGVGRKKINYKLRDWLFSRQRYWGEPFPIVHMEKSGSRGVDLAELPVKLPNVVDYEPTEKGEPPLARIQEFVDYTDPKTGEKGRRDTDTMPGSAGSSWYFLRYTDPINSTAPFAFAAQKYWMPVDLYIGGPEHTVGHLLYARFWQKVLFDAGLVSHDEPFQRLAHQGVLLAPDGQRMSKSRGNTVNCDDVRESYGADAIRLYLNFLGPFEKDKPWSTTGIEGIRRFLDRIWRLALQADDTKPAPEIERLLHKTIKKVGEDIESLSFNTAISAMMILVNEMYKTETNSKALVMPLLQILMPFAPHFAEELWERLGGSGFVSLAPWPSYDPVLVTDSEQEMGVQVNGKMRGTIRVSLDTSEIDAVARARAVSAVANALEGKVLIKVIYKPGKILNMIVK